MGRAAGERKWKPLMRPCVIRELSRPNEALTYLSYQPLLAPSCLLHTQTSMYTDECSTEVTADIGTGTTTSRFFSLLAVKRTGSGEKDNDDDRDDEDEEDDRCSFASHHLPSNNHALQSTREHQDKAERMKDAVVAATGRRVDTFVQRIYIFIRRTISCKVNFN